MTPSEFVERFYQAAKNVEAKYNIPAISILAQAAHESGWGRVAPGNMFFGVKDTDGVNGNEQLLLTTEYSRRRDLKFPVIISITPVIRNGLPYYKYRIRDYFRKYNSPEESFEDHAKFFYRNKRYKEALKTNDPIEFLVRVAKAGYATDPDYEAKMKSIAARIKKELILLGYN